ncbi:MAG: tetratricopeptide repeat protein [Betaproteobacteria bacterium]
MNADRTPLPRTNRLQALRASLLGVVMTAFLCTTAQANPYQEVQRLSSSGQHGKALAQADAYLSEKPRDPQMRFLRGVTLTEIGRGAEAEEIFRQLTREFPELPEPYNNLAVLLAARQDLDQARVLLEAALRNDPSYATAHENLGDVLAQLAARSYAKALQIEPGRSSNRRKIGQLQQMLSLGHAP